MKKIGARIILSLFILSFLTLFQNCGGGGGGSGGEGAAANSNWYFHYDCYTDYTCLNTNPTGDTYGDLNEGPVYANCEALLYFANNNWGYASHYWCDNSPHGSVGGGGTGGLNAPKITGINPSSGPPNTTYPQISGTNFPTSTSAVTATYCGRTVQVNSATSTMITVKIPPMPSCKSPITISTAAGSANSPPFTTLNTFRTVASSGSVIVIGGDYGTVLSSTDGIHWIPRSTDMNPNFGGFNASNWNGSQFLIAGDNGYTYRSFDGATWDAFPRYGSYTQSLLWSGTQYVNAGSVGVLATSPDGGSWTSVSPSSNDIYYGLAYNGSTYVVVGQNKIYASGNSTSWTEQIAPNDGQRRAVAWTGSNFVIVGPNGIVYLSSTGYSDWLQTNIGISFGLYSIAVGGSEVVAVGQTGTIVSSPGWTSRSSGTGMSLYGVTWTGSQFVAVGQKNTILTSPDGITWTTRQAF